MMLLNLSIVQDSKRSPQQGLCNRKSQKRNDQKQRFNGPIDESKSRGTLSTLKGEE